MTWRDGLFLHWPVDPDDLRPQVPAPLELDTRDGQAWISILPFVLARAGFRGTPTISRLTFPELNVRTYVRYDGDPGLFFFSIDVDSALVASSVGRLTRLPVYRAQMHVGGDDERIAFSSARHGLDLDHGGGHSHGDEHGNEYGRGDGDTHSENGNGGELEHPTPARFSATYCPDGPVFYADPDSLEYWLTARRRLYAPEHEGVLTAEIAHAPWPLQPADVTIHENTMFAANDLPKPTGDVIANYCGELAMTGSIARRLRER